MGTTSIIREIDSEISRLEHATAILSGTTIKRSPGRPKQTQSFIKTVAAEPTKRVMSAEVARRLQPRRNCVGLNREGRLKKP
jgi:hypothetical protein